MWDQHFKMSDITYNPAVYDVQLSTVSLRDVYFGDMYKIVRIYTDDLAQYCIISIVD